MVKSLITQRRSTPRRPLFLRFLVRARGARHRGGGGILAGAGAATGTLSIDSAIARTGVCYTACIDSRFSGGNFRRAVSVFIPWRWCPPHPSVGGAARGLGVGSGSPGRRRCHQLPGRLARGGTIGPRRGNPVSVLALEFCWLLAAAELNRISRCRAAAFAAAEAIGRGDLAIPNAWALFLHRRLANSPKLPHKD
jgi:hypothetical protein